MKSDGQINQKIKQVIFRHRKAYIQKRLARHPDNCTFNDRVGLPIHMSNRASLGVCGYCDENDEPNNVTCDASMGGEQQAIACPYFEADKEAEELKKEFNENLGIEGGSPKEIGYIAKEYPDVAALLWVLGPSKDAKTAEPPQKEEPNILAFFGNGETVEDVPERPLVEEDDES